MSKRRYRATKIQEVDSAKLMRRAEQQVIVAIDVAKEDFYAALVDEGGQVIEILKWRHPAESMKFLGLVERLGGNERVEVVMEPSGVYGDAIRAALEQRGVPVFRVSPKRVHDAAEVFDGVPSLHDAKAATLIARLHLGGASEPWPTESEHRRRLAAMLRVLEVHEKEARRNRSRLEGLLARHWPGVTSVMSPDSATMLEVLIEFGGPAAVVERPNRARDLMRRVGGNFLSDAKIDAVTKSAQNSLGVPQLDEELQLVRVVASEARRQRKAANKAKKRLEKLALIEGSATKSLAPVIGASTSAVVVASTGEPQKFASSAAYVKALGLNLKEKSSGKLKGRLRITKRGPGVARVFLYLATLRLIQRDGIARAWYSKKVARDGSKQKALVALMRKLASALWHVARGAVFDSTKLFDVQRLRINSNLGEVPLPNTV